MSKAPNIFQSREVVEAGLTILRIHHGFDTDGQALFRYVKDRDPDNAEATIKMLEEIGIIEDMRAGTIAAIIETNKGKLSKISPQFAQVLLDLCEAKFTTHYAGKGSVSDKFPNTRQEEVSSLRDRIGTALWKIAISRRFKYTWREAVRMAFTGKHKTEK